MFRYLCWKTRQKHWGRTSCLCLIMTVLTFGEDDDGDTHEQKERSCFQLHRWNNNDSEWGQKSFKHTYASPVTALIITWPVWTHRMNTIYKSIMKYLLNETFPCSTILICTCPAFSLMLLSWICCRLCVTWAHKVNISVWLWVSQACVDSLRALVMCVSGCVAVIVFKLVCFMLLSVLILFHFWPSNKSCSLKCENQIRNLTIF